MRLSVFALLFAVTALHAQTPIAITNVTIVDVAAGALRANQTVVVLGARIAAAGDASRVRVPAGARVVSGKGGFLIPGIWDMHVHDFPHPHVPELYLVNGVTGVRSMYDVPALRGVRTAIEQHRRPGPRVMATGRALNGEREKNEQVVVRTAAQAREAVHSQIRDGVDFIKVYNGLPREAYFAIADEAKRAHIPFVGHTPDALTTIEAAAAGQRSIEHLDGVLLDCSPLGAWLRKSGRFLPDQRLLDTFDPARASTVFAAYVRHGVWHCPTLTIYQPANLANLDRVPKVWRPRPDKTLLKDTPRDFAIHKKTMEVTGDDVPRGRAFARGNGHRHAVHPPRLRPARRIGTHGRGRHSIERRPTHRDSRAGSVSRPREGPRDHRPRQARRPRSPRRRPAPIHRQHAADSGRRCRRTALRPRRARSDAGGRQLIHRLFGMCGTTGFSFSAGSSNST
jgi:hypothetical protein